MTKGTRGVSRRSATDFVEPGLAVWAPELAQALRRAAHANSLALHLDRGDGAQGGSDYLNFFVPSMAFVKKVREGRGRASATTGQGRRWSASWPAESSQRRPRKTCASGPLGSIPQR